MSRTLPHSTAAEKSAVGSVLVKPSVFPTVHLQAGHFFDARCRAVWEAFGELAAADRAIDVATVEDSLERADRLTAIGGIAFLSELAISTPTSANVEHYAGIVREHAKSREVILAASDVVTAGYEGAAEGDELLSMLAAASRRVRPASRRGVSSAKALAERRTRELMALSERQSSGENCARVPTGLGALDRTIGGLPRGNHTGLVAQTGHGKTAVLMHMAFNTPEPALVFTFEELQRDSVDRFLAARTSIPAIDITALKFSGRQLAEIIAAANSLPEDVYFVDARGMTDEDVVRTARQLVPELGVGLVAIDYLNRVRLSASPKLRTDERMRESLGMFDDCCGELDVAWVTAAQVNRAPGRENRAPRITDARECAALEEYSKLGLVVHRPWRGTGKPDDEIDVIVDKANIGPDRSRYQFLWDGPTMTIRPAPPHTVPSHWETQEGSDQ